MPLEITVTLIDTILVVQYCSRITHYYWCNIAVELHIITGAILQ